MRHKKIVKGEEKEIKISEDYPDSNEISAHVLERYRLTDGILTKKSPKKVPHFKSMLEMKKFLIRLW